MRTRRRWRALVPFLLPALIVPMLSEVPAGAASASTPRLDLRGPASTVDLIRYGKREPVWLEFSVYLAALDAPFELRVRRESYDDPVRVWQALDGPGGTTLQELPSDVLDGWLGLAGFMRIQLYSLDGRLLRHRVSTICPGGWDVQRLDDSGPFQPTYPPGCTSNPFALGTVWGIDQGWAVAPSWMTDMSVRVRDGDYRAVVSIAPRYRELFGIADADAVVEFGVHIRTKDGCRYCYGSAAPEVRDRRSSLTPAVAAVEPDPDTIPDLVALPAFGIDTGSKNGRDLLSFGSNVWNRGPASLVVEGFRADGEDTMDAYQYFFDGGSIVGRANVGSFEFDTRAGHQHWHFRQFARYRLLDETLARVVRSHKQSFCLAPTDGIDLSVDGAVWRPDELGWSQCGWSSSALWIRELMPTGWGDTYYQGVGGQAFEITDVPNGTYWIEVHANPLGLLFDRDPSNDTELREVVLGGTPGARTVFVPPWHGIDSG